MIPRTLASEWRALASEWTKLRAVRSTRWSLFATVVLSIAASALISASASSDDSCLPGTTGCETDPVGLSLGGVYLGQMAVVALAVTAIGSEYATKMIRTTLTATPRRRMVLSAKAAVVAALVLGVGLVTSVASFHVGQALLSVGGHTAAAGYTTPSLGDGPTLRAVVRSSLYLAVLALFSLGIAAILRHTAAAMATVLGLLWFPLIPISILPQDVGLQVAKFCPMTAGLAVQHTVERADSVPIAPWAGFGVFCGYASAALIGAMWQIKARDA